MMDDAYAINERTEQILGTMQDGVEAADPEWTAWYYESLRCAISAEYVAMNPSHIDDPDALKNALLHLADADSAAIARIAENAARKVAETESEMLGGEQYASENLCAAMKQALGTLYPSVRQTPRSR